MTNIADADAPEEVMWQGQFITARRRGRWEYVGRARGIRAAVILAVDDEDHVILVDQYRVPLGRRCVELPAGLVGDHEAGAQVLIGACTREQATSATTTRARWSRPARCCRG